MVDTDVVMEVVVEVGVMEAVDVVRAVFLYFSGVVCLGNMMGVRVMIELVWWSVVWWRWSVV